MRLMVIVVLVSVCSLEFIGDFFFEIVKTSIVFNRTFENRKFRIFFWILSIFFCSKDKNLLENLEKKWNSEFLRKKKQYLLRYIECDWYKWYFAHETSILWYFFVVVVVNRRFPEFCTVTLFFVFYVNPGGVLIFASLLFIHWWLRLFLTVITLEQKSDRRLKFTTTLFNSVYGNLISLDFGDDYTISGLNVFNRIFRCQNQLCPIFLPNFFVFLALLKILMQ